MTRLWDDSEQLRRVGKTLFIVAAILAGVAGGLWLLPSLPSIDGGDTRAIALLAVAAMVTLSVTALRWAARRTRVVVLIGSTLIVLVLAAVLLLAYLVIIIVSGMEPPPTPPTATVTVTASAAPSPPAPASVTVPDPGGGSKPHEWIASVAAALSALAALIATTVSVRATRIKRRPSPPRKVSTGRAFSRRRGPR